MTNEKKYLKRLRKALKSIPTSEREEILSDYKEHFDAGRADGKTDGNIAAGLGDPLEIASEHLASRSQIQEAGAKARYRRSGSWPRALLVTMALIVFNLIFIVGPFVGLVGGMVGLWAASVSPAFVGGRMMLASNATVVSSGMENASWYFAALGMVALAFFLVALMILLSRVFIWLVSKYTKLNIRVALGARRSA